MVKLILIKASNFNQFNEKRRWHSMVLFFALFICLALSRFGQFALELYENDYAICISRLL